MRPVIGITGFTGIDDGGESRRGDDTLQFIDQFSFNKGRHFFKVGGEVRRIKLDVLNNPANTRGDFNFGNQEWTGLEGFAGTGNTFANFLLGLPRQKARRPGDHSSFLRATEYAGFFQDDFKATPKLTINYGVRYQLYISPRETRNNISSIRIPHFPASFAEGGIAFCKDRQRCANLPTTLDPLRLGLTLNDLHVDRLPQIVVAGKDAPRSLVEIEKYNFGPRIGIAYRLTQKTVIRTGYGLFYDTVPVSYFQDSVENLPFVREDQQSLSSFQFGLPTPETFIGYLLDDPPIGSFTPGPNTFGINFQNAYVQHWNFGVQQQLGNNFVAEVTYAGSKGTRLNRRENFNTREPRSPNAIIPTSVNPHLRRLLPFAVFEGQLITLDNWFETTSTAFSAYHSLMSRFEKRFSGGLRSLTPSPGRRRSATPSPSAAAITTPATASRTFTTRRLTKRWRLMTTSSASPPRLSMSFHSAGATLRRRRSRSGKPFDRRLAGQRDRDAPVGLSRSRSGAPETRSGLAPMARCGPTRSATRLSPGASGRATR